LHKKESKRKRTEDTPEADRMRERTGVKQGEIAALEKKQFHENQTVLT